MSTYLNNHNGISKTFEQDVYNDTQKAEAKVQEICPDLTLKLMNEEQEGKKIDIQILSGEHHVVIGAIEVEVRYDSWNTHDFPYSTASLLAKKEKYGNLPYPAFFIGFNWLTKQDDRFSDETMLTNCYLTTINGYILQDKYVEKIRRKQQSRAVSGEKAYRIPVKSCIWGFDSVQPFIMNVVATDHKNRIDAQAKISKLEKKLREFQ
jgi:hypothetical protein